jgi:predicted permease
MSDHMVHGRTMRMMDLFGELKPGVGPQQVRSEVATIAHRLRAAYPEPRTERTVPDVLPVVPVKDELTSQFRPTLLVLLGTVGLVLLLACANVANLTLARLMSREREVVVRSAIGAGRWRLVRQLLTESTLLSLLGGALGLALSFAGLRLLVAFAALFTPRSSEVRIDGGVLLFTFVVSGLTGLLFGCVPAFQATNRDISTALKEASGRTTGGAGGHGFRSLLIVLQVAISFVLLLGAGLMLRSLVALQQVDLGFKPQNVLAVRITLPFSRYTKQAQFRAFFDQLVQRAAAQPGVLAVGLANDRPLSGGLVNRDLQIEGRTTPADQEQPKAAFHIVSPEYFRVLGVPLLRGRLLTPADDESGLQVALINDSMARQYWPGQDPIGKRIQMTNGRSGWRTIVGVVRDLRQRGLEDAPGPAYFYPLAQAPVNRAQLFVRTTASPLAMVGALQSIVRGLDPQQPVSDVQTLEQALADSLAPSRLTTVLLGLFAALAFLITGAGVSGVLAVFVSERTQEIGVRSALGASRGEVLGLVLRQSMTLMLVGLVLGALGAAALTRLLARLLYGVQPNDPLTFVAVAGFLLLVVAAACLIPARRALAIDPALALRA